MIPTFTDLTAQEQCLQLQEYFESLGANLVKNPNGECLDVGQFIVCCNLCLKEAKEVDAECVLNSIVTLLIQVPPTEPVCAKYIKAFCDKLVESANSQNAPLCLRVLENLNEGIGINPHLSYDVYTALLKIAGNNGLVDQVYDDLNKVKSLYHPNNVGLDQVQRLLRLLHDVLTKNNSKDASKVMIELLSTYTEENASKARTDAFKCIVSTLADPNTFLMDNLLTLKPVKYLEGEAIHDLLTIFVSEKLNGYISYYNTHKAFIVEQLKLSHDQNLQKMRLLTFMQMAESKKEITFQDIQTELQLAENEVEAFVIDVLKTRLVKAKVDQVCKRVVVTSTMHRTFGKQQWQQLRDTLTQWQTNLAHVHSAIASATRAQLDNMGVASGVPS